MSSMFPQTCGAVVMAAGQGTRLGCTDIPKVMLPLEGKPMIEYTVQTLGDVGFTPERIVLVIGFHGETIQAHFGAQVVYAEQKERKGTAHAAYTGIRALSQEISHVLVMGGDDSAFYRPETLRQLVESHIAGGFTLSLLSADIPGLTTLGRVVRGGNGEVSIVEKENLTEEQRVISEISTGTFVFDRVWFESIFPRITPIKNLGELGLPQTLEIAKADGKLYQVIPLKNPKEWCGVNTPEELRVAKERKRER